MHTLQESCKITVNVLDAVQRSNHSNIAIRSDDDNSPIWRDTIRHVGLTTLDALDIDVIDEHPETGQNRPPANDKEDSLRPVRPQYLWHRCIVDRLLLANHDRKDLEYSIPNRVLISALAVLLQETTRRACLLGKGLDLVALRLRIKVACEHDDFEARVRRKEVLKLDGPEIGGANDNLWWHPGANDEVVGKRLVSGVCYG